MSPCPGGHHSRSGSAAHDTGSSVSASSLGDLFWRSSESGWDSSSACSFARNARVSSDVENEFMRTKRRPAAPVASRVCFTWRAMRSKKVLPSFTGRRDLAFSRPIEVPRPPLSLRTAVLERRVWIFFFGGG